MDCFTFYYTNITWCFKILSDWYIRIYIYIYIYIYIHTYIHTHIKVKWSRYRPVVAQKVGRGIALLFDDRGTRRGWVVSNTPRPHFTPGKEPVPILQEAGWAPGPVWAGGKSRPHRDSIPDRPARSQSLYTRARARTQIQIIGAVQKYKCLTFDKRPCCQC